MGLDDVFCQCMNDKRAYVRKARVEARSPASYRCGYPAVIDPAQVPSQRPTMQFFSAPPAWPNIIANPRENTCFVVRRCTFSERREFKMYALLVTAMFASTIFVPSFIGIRARTNADWRKL